MEGSRTLPHPPLVTSGSHELSPRALGLHALTPSSGASPKIGLRSGQGVGLAGPQPHAWLAWPPTESHSAMTENAGLPEAPHALPRPRAPLPPGSLGLSLSFQAPPRWFDFCISGNCFSLFVYSFYFPFTCHGFVFFSMSKFYFSHRPR